MVKPGKPTAVTVTLQPDVTAEVERVAEEEGCTKSELLQLALNKYLSDRRWEKMFRENEANARKLGIFPEDVQRFVYDIRDERRPDSGSRS